MKNRIFKVMRWTGLNLSQFAEAIQVSPALLSSVKSERTKPTLLLVENIKKVYPEVDVNWLITGNGNMIVGTSSSGLHIIANDTDIDTDISDITKQVAPPATPKDTTSSPVVKSQPSPIVETQQPTTTAPEVDSIPQVAEVQQPPVTSSPVTKTVKHLLLLYTDGTYETYEKSL